MVENGPILGGWTAGQSHKFKDNWRKCWRFWQSLSSIKLCEGWKVKQLIQTQLPKSSLSSFLEFSTQFGQSTRIIIFSHNNISHFLPLEMTATAPPPAEGSWGPSLWVTCTKLCWKLSLDVLTGLPAQEQEEPWLPPSQSRGWRCMSDSRQAKKPGFSQEFGTAGTEKSCRCGRKLFTAWSTIKSSERGDLRIWDKVGGHPHPFWAQYREIWPLLRRWAPGALWHFAEQVPVGAGWRLIVSCTFLAGGGREGVLFCFNASKSLKARTKKTWFSQVFSPFHVFSTLVLYPSTLSLYSFPKPGKHPTWEKGQEAKLTLWFSQGKIT